eukprot:TRINITY_DN17473_c0_g2_i1.p1 TRINITY_DN17473_c0_g2~~TRINITY_DN17473_c0_g2_i1.p1  ORF type:complete len:791 (+),score=267.22 TRINITY_DN17473_c0_g2_i1:86-2458(+)
MSGQLRTGAGFCTTLDNPKCRRLKSVMERASESYDARVLRRKRSRSAVAAARPRSAPAAPPPSPGAAPDEPSARRPVSPSFSRGSRRQPPKRTSPTGEPQLQRELGDDTLWQQWARDKAAQPGSLPQRALFGGERGRFSSEVAADAAAGGGAAGRGEDDAASQLYAPVHPGHREVRDWLHGSLFLARQAEAHETFTRELRGQTRALKQQTDSRAREGRKGTNEKLRQRVRATEREKERVEQSLHAVATEHAVLGRVKQFVAELRAMTESGSLAGCQMRLSLRASRPKGELVRDAAQAALQTEHRGLVDAVDALERLTLEADAQLRKLAQAQTDLYTDLEDKVEGLRIDEQCLVLDGSTSQKPHMGGSAAFQPPLDIVLDAAAKTAIQGLGGGTEEGAVAVQSRPSTKELLDTCDRLVMQSVELRGRIKKKLISIDQRTRADNRMVEAALQKKVRQQGTLLAALDERVEGLRGERRRLEEQMHFVRAGLEETNKEKDIVCKRLRLRQQRPMRPDAVDKVQEALEEEYDLLAEAVHEYSGKLSHITLEVSRMQETLRLIEAEATAKRTAFSLDRECMELPFAHRLAFPHALFSSICGARSFVYGVVLQDDAQARSERAHGEDGTNDEQGAPMRSDVQPAPWGDEVTVLRSTGARSPERWRNVDGAARDVLPHRAHKKISEALIQRMRDNDEGGPPPVPPALRVPGAFGRKQGHTVWKASGSRSPERGPGQMRTMESEGQWRVVQGNRELHAISDRVIPQRQTKSARLRPFLAETARSVGATVTSNTAVTKNK